MGKSIKSWFKIKNIVNGVIELKDDSLCKVLEVQPINFSLKSEDEQESILYNYKNFLNTCDFDIQILVQSKKGNLDSHISKIKSKMESEQNEKVIRLMKKYIDMINNETLKSSITKRFFIIVSEKCEKGIKKELLLVKLQEKTLKITTALSKCGNNIKTFDKNNDELVSIIYTYMNPTLSEIQEFKEINYEYKN